MAGRLNHKARRKLKAVGAIPVTVFAGIDTEGEAVGWFWRRNDDAVSDVHGPFATRSEAEEDLRVVLFGRDTKIIEGGSLKRDPALEGLH
jgi:hypothetical protein